MNGLAHPILPAIPRRTAKRDFYARGGNIRDVDSRFRLILRPLTPSSAVRGFVTVQRGMFAKPEPRA
jgi:hypothetical protein